MKKAYESVMDDARKLRLQFEHKSIDTFTKKAESFSLFNIHTLNRNRYIYLLFLVTTIAAGLASRHFSIYLPPLVKLYLGDTLWALMVFLLFGLLLTRKSTLWVAVAALLFSFAIEISQLYHSSWIDSLRSYPLGGLILGYGFLWSDLLCYTLGVGFGYIMEKVLLKRHFFTL